jgi:hypothetical protein
MVLGASRGEGIQKRDWRGRSIDGGRGIERGGHPMVRDLRGRSIDGGRSIEREGHLRVRDWRGRKTMVIEASRGEGIKG